jgi:hypothetical protein
MPNPFPANDKGGSMKEEEIGALFVPLEAELNDDFVWLINNHPLLAHYTSIDVIEKILRSTEIWLSNPLFMNDLEEMRFGMLEGRRLFEESEAVKQFAGSQARVDRIKYDFNFYFNQFDNEHAIDVYVFSMSEHDPENMDGLLSMWRGYGGQGNGAALVFNTGFITSSEDKSPLALTRVSYASRETRRSWLQIKIQQWCNSLMTSSTYIPDEKLYVVAYRLFNLIKLFALKFKHDGFHEEREWRIIYMPDRDPQGVFLKERFGYVIGRHGVEPKLKLKIEPLLIEPRDTWTFSTILERIILGPSVASPLARSSVMRMLENIGKAEFAQKVVASTIPLRPI